MFYAVLSPIRKSTRRLFPVPVLSLCQPPWGSPRAAPGRTWGERSAPQHQAVSGSWPFFPAAVSLGPWPCHRSHCPGGHREGQLKRSRQKAESRRSRARLSSALLSTLCVCNILPAPCARLCVLASGVTCGLINPQGVTLSSHFLLLLSPAAASRGHSSSVMSTCGWTKLFKGLR